MLKENSPTSLLNDSFIEEVDLDYKFLIDDKDASVYIKFNGFRDELQMKQFTEYMYYQLPLLFTGPTKH